MQGKASNENVGPAETKKAKAIKGEHTLQRNQHKQCGHNRKPNWLEQYKKSGSYAL